jgi:perosamine synthetase
MTKSVEKQFVPVNEPVFCGNEKKYLLECIESGWISSEGPFVRRFEEEFSARVGRRYGVAVSSGTAALDVAVAALGVGEGDEVIMPTFTIISCAQAIVRAGGKPVLVDSDAVTWNMDVNQIEGKITSRTKAIMTVHIYGLCVDMGSVLELADKYKVKVIEDAAQAHGQTYRSNPCGSFGDVSIFSFYPNKLVTTGEGGMVVTDDESLAERCKSLRNLCFRKGRRFVHEELGWNYRMTNLQAAVGVAQLERLSQYIERKMRIGSRYTELLEGIDGLQLPVVRTNYAENIYWVYGIVIDDRRALDSAEVMSRLAEKGIGTRPFFWPMHEQPVFKKMGLFKEESYPVAERLARQGFYLPSGLGLRDEQMEYVAGCIKELFA